MDWTGLQGSFPFIKEQILDEGGDGEQLEDKGLGHAPTPLPHIIPPDIIPLIMTVFLPPAFSWRTSPSVAPEPCSLRPSDGGGS